MNTNYDKFFETEDQKLYDFSNATLREVITAYVSEKDASPSVLKWIKHIEVNSGKVLLPEHVGNSFYKNLFRMLTGEGILPSTAKNYASTIRSALRWAAMYNAKLSPTYYTFPKFSLPDRYLPALTSEQLTMIECFDILANMPKADAIEKKVYSKKDGKFKQQTLKQESPKNRQRKRHARSVMLARDMFVLQCELGQRHSDMIRLSPCNFPEGGTYFRIVQQKTGTTVSHPLNSKYCINHRRCKRILEKYNYEAPYKGNVRNYNRHLQFLFSMMGGQFTEIIDSDNGKPIRMCDKMRSHTARRTACCVAELERGMPISVIKRISGHKDSRTLDIYLKQGREED